MDWRSRCNVAGTMRSGLLIPLLLGSLAGCTLYFEDDGGPVDPGDSPEPDPDPGPDPVPPSPPTPSQRAKALLAEWSGCMSLQNFTSAGMATAWGQILSDSGECTQCHTEGSRDFPISKNAEAFFKVISEHSMSMLLFFGVHLGSPADKIVVNTTAIQAVGSGQAPHSAHPRFSVAGGLTALTKFYNSTMTRKAAGQCDPPRLID